MVYDWVAALPWERRRLPASTGWDMRRLPALPWDILRLLASEGWDTISATVWCLDERLFLQYNSTICWLLPL